MTRTILYHSRQFLKGTSQSTITVQEFLKAQGFSTKGLIGIKHDPEGILVNGAPAFMNYPLQSGDQLSVTIREEESSTILPKPCDFTIVYEDQDILLINKPAGLPIHPSINHYEDSLANGVCAYYHRQGIPFVFRCINRLDKDTSGLTLIAKHSIAAGILGQQVSLKQDLKRQYLAMIHGTLDQKEGTIDAPIGRCSDSIITREINFEAGERAVTHYRVMEEKNGYSLLSLVLETGRTHQIRVHMKYLGFPLVGDQLYEGPLELLKRQALHSYRLSFIHPITKEHCSFTAPLPLDMAQLWSSF